MMNPRNKAIISVALALLLASCDKTAKVVPAEGTIDGVEYVNVRHEPQHRHEFENDDIRIYDVLLPPGYVTLNHAHTRDTIYVVVKGSKLKSVPLVGSMSMPVAIPVPTGAVLWNEHSKEPLIHEVTNAGDNAARLVGVELKYEDTIGTRDSISANGLNTHDTYDNVRAYLLELAPGESTGKMTMEFEGLIIALTEATIALASDAGTPRVSSLEPASWILLGSSGEVSISNIGISPLRAVVYEFP